MLNLKNNENDAEFDENCNKNKNKSKIKFQKIKVQFFRQDPLVEKSPTATDFKSLNQAFYKFYKP